MAMDFSFAGIGLQHVKSKCSEYYETAKTKVQAFCCDVEKLKVFQCFMGKAKDLGHEAREFWVNIFSRKTTEAEATSSIREKYGVVQDDGDLSRTTFADNIRTQREQERGFA